MLKSILAISFYVDSNGTGDKITYDLECNSSWIYKTISTIENVPSNYPMAIFQSHRSAKFLAYNIYGFESNSNNQLSLGFAETYTPNCMPRQRIFNVLVNGSVIASDVDVFAQAGCATAYIVSFQVQADADGNYNIHIVGTVNDAMISFLAISPTHHAVPADITPPEHVTATSIRILEPLKQNSSPMSIQATNSSLSMGSKVAVSLENGKWSKTLVRKMGRRSEACFVFDNVSRRAYLLGGRGRKAVDIYDPTTQTWSKGKKPPRQLHHMQCNAIDGKIWIVSAWEGYFPREKNVADIHIYDTATDLWSTRQGLPEERRRGGAAAVAVGRRIYVSHGNRGGHETWNHAESFGWLDYYDIDQDIWVTNLPDAPNPRDHTGGAFVNGEICIAGGRLGGDRGFFNKVVLPTDCYNVNTGKWSVKANIPQGRAGSSYGTTCDGKLILAGGEGFGKAWTNVDVFDGSSWISLPNLNTARHGSGLAIDCECNQIHIASGSGRQARFPELCSVETFLPQGVEPQCTS